jgi:type I restriction enzyme S subunit
MKWPVTSIGKLCVPTGQRDPTASPDSPFRYIDIASVDKDAKRITAALEMQGAEAPSRARKEVRAGDVLVSTVRPNLNAVALVPEDLDGQIASTGFCVLRADKKIAEGKFIFYRCLTSEFVSSLVSQMRGANYPAVSDGVVKRAEIPFPAPREQRRIVELLEQADGLRRQRAEADQLADRILPALFHKMFGDPATNPKGWPLEPLGKLTKVQCGYAFKSDDFVADGVLLVRISNLVDGAVRISEGSAFLPRDFYERHETFRLALGDLLIALSGATTGKLARYDVENVQALLNQRVGRFLVRAAPRSVLDYLEVLLQSPYARNLITMEMQGGGQPNLAPRELESLAVPRPPDNLLNEFGAYTTTFRHLARQSESSEKNLEDLFATMLHRAFTGELTAKWREAHLKELLAEMEQQARLLRATGGKN